MLELIVFSTLNGLLYGMLLFLLASGLTLIFSMMGVLNFAHASFYMLGAYFGYQISRWVGYWPGLVLAPLLVGGVGALVERFGLRTVHKHGHVAELLFTFGIAYIIEELVQMVWGKVPVDYRVPAELNFPAFTLWATNYPAFRMFMLLMSVAVFIGLLLLLTRHPRGPDHPRRAHAPAHGGHAGPQRAAGLHGGVRRRLRAGRAGRCDRRAGPGHATGDGGVARAHPLRHRGGGRPGLAARGLCRVAADTG